MSKQKARIENWVMVGRPGNGYLIGEIRDHPRQDSFHSPYQHTSTLLVLDEENGMAETANTIYVLGKKGR